MLYKHSVTIHMTRTTGRVYNRVRYFEAKGKDITSADEAARINAKHYDLRVNRRGGVVQVETLARGHFRHHIFVPQEAVLTGVRSTVYRDIGAGKKKKRRE